MHEEALCRHTDLPRVIVAAFDDRTDDRIDLCAAVDDDGCGSAMLQRASRTRRQLAFEVPADLCRADEAQKRDARIGRKTLGKRVVVCDQRLAPAFVQTQPPRTA